MSPAIPYIFALALYIAFAVLVWLAASIIAIVPERRLFAKRIAMGMAGSFPGVFLFQLLCLPILGIVLLVFNIASSFGRPHEIFIVMAVISLMLLPLIASLRGFYLGWLVASEWAMGGHPMKIVASDWLLGPVGRLLQKITNKNSAQQDAPSNH